MVWYFIGVYIINRALHDRLEIRNFSSRVEKNISQHLKRNFVSPRGHVISSIYVVASEGFILSHYIISTICFALLSFVQIMIPSVLCLVMHGYEFETLDNNMCHVSNRVALDITILNRKDRATALFNKGLIIAEEKFSLVGRTECSLLHSRF